MSDWLGEANRPIVSRSDLLSIFPMIFSGQGVPVSNCTIPVIVEQSRRCFSLAPPYVHIPVRKLYGAICALHKPICVLYGAVCALHKLVCIPYGTICALHKPICALYGAICALYGVICALHGATCALYEAICTLYGAICPCASRSVRCDDQVGASLPASMLPASLFTPKICEG